MKKGIIIVGFMAIGKTTLAKKYSFVVDLESSNYKYLLDDDIKKLDIEQRKGLKGRQKNLDYPQNYFEAIMKNYHDGKIVLVAAKKDIVDYLKFKNVDFYWVYPKEEMLDEIILRCHTRGNQLDFINKIKDVYIRDFPYNLDKVMWLDAGEYIEDALKKYKII